MGIRCFGAQLSVDHFDNKADESELIALENDVDDSKQGNQKIHTYLVRSIYELMRPCF